jgi:chromate transporter
MAIGYGRAGVAGLIAAFLAFTLPSAMLLAGLALLSGSLGGVAASGVLHGLKLAAVAVVGSAVVGMARSLAPDMPRRLVALAATVIAFTIPTTAGELAVLGLGALYGLTRARPADVAALPVTERVPGKGTAVAALGLFILLLAGLPLLAGLSGATWLRIADAFYRAGALVFGGGHVVLPLLKADLVPRFLGPDAFLAGYGAAQAVPGPLFSFSAYVGALVPGGVGGAALATLAMFLPAMLLVAGALPFWERLKRFGRVRGVLAGVNAAVVGLIAAAFADPVLTSGVSGPADAALALVALLALEASVVPAWAVVLVMAAAGPVLV